MTLDEIRLVFYRYFLCAPAQRAKELAAACRSIGHGRIEIVIQNEKIVQVNILGTEREDPEMEKKIRELLAGQQTANAH